MLLQIQGPPRTLRTCFDPSDFGKAQRVRYGQVSVQRDAAKEGDADVDVGVEDEAKELAALLAVDPVVTLQEVVDPQRKGADVEKVSHRQVDQVDAQLVALAYLQGGKEQSVKIWLCFHFTERRVLIMFLKFNQKVQ